MLKFGEMTATSAVAMHGVGTVDKKVNTDHIANLADKFKMPFTTVLRAHPDHSVVEFSNGESKKILRVNSDGTTTQVSESISIVINKILEKRGCLSKYISENFKQ